MNLSCLGGVEVQLPQGSTAVRSVAVPQEVVLKMTKCKVVAARILCMSMIPFLIKLYRWLQNESQILAAGPMQIPGEQSPLDSGPSVVGSTY